MKEPWAKTGLETDDAKPFWKSFQENQTPSSKTRKRGPSQPMDSDDQPTVEDNKAEPSTPAQTTAKKRQRQSTAKKRRLN
mmetsp:Transcript_38812/g.80615  ORF Transcript_38812/g.80615 Transcript_38812/m.80615 type:complete len:80 (+) Transcript_38812:721-960(+)